MKKAALEAEGRQFYDGGYMPACTPDGFFDKVQHDPYDYKKMYCVDRDGVQIEDFEGNMDDPEAMTCECAWARR